MTRHAKNHRQAKGNSPVDSWTVEPGRVSISYGLEPAHEAETVATPRQAGLGSTFSPITIPGENLSDTVLLGRR
jgi:hypothetical protein